MTAGFEVLRSTGEVAVSSEYPHYSFIKRIKGSGNFYDTSGQQYSDYVLVFFVNTAASLTQIQMGGFTTVRFSKGSKLLWGDGTTPPIDATLSMHSWQETYAYIFDIIRTSLPSNAGIIVKSEDGQVTFDSGNRYLKILDVINSSEPISASYTYPAGSVVGLCLLKSYASYEWSRDSGTSYTTLTWYKIHQNKFDLIYNETSSNSGTGSGYNESPGIEAIVADLSILSDLFPGGLIN